MKTLKKFNLIFTVVLVGYLSLSSIPAARGFTTFYHQGRGGLNNLLMHKVHAPFWTIHYNFEDCGEVDEETQKKYTQVVTTFVQSWLQPLREYTDRPIVNDFRYRLSDDERGADFTIKNICEWCRSSAFTGGRLHIKNCFGEFKLTWRWAHPIPHELGHLFGLGDTYLEIPDWGKPGLDTGGSDATLGSHPSSYMSGIVLSFGMANENDADSPIPLQGVVPLGIDDSNGMIWLYKFIYEDLELRDCLFPNYKLENVPAASRHGRSNLGCVPKYPLIFALKDQNASNEGFARLILEGDENLDVNVQDANGLTALHYAILNRYTRTIEALLSRRDIDVNTRDAEGSTALFWAAKRGSYGAVERLLKHKSIDMNVRGAGGNAPLKEAATQNHTRIVDLLLEQEPRDSDWTVVEETVPVHQRSVFYLMPRDGRRLVFHAGYLGTVLGGDALFIAQKREQDSRENIEKYLNRDDLSLVGYDGLVAEDVKVRALASFPGASEKTGSVLLAIRDVDFSGYAPLALSLYPHLRETDVELLTYKFGSGVALEDGGEALNLPLRVRRCVAVPHAGLGALGLYQHTCGPANSVSEGSVLFDEKDGTIIGFYRSQEGSEILGDGLPLADVVSEALMGLVDRKPVSPKNRLTTTWAEIKRRE